MWAICSAQPNWEMNTMNLRKLSVLSLVFVLVFGVVGLAAAQDGEMPEMPPPPEIDGAVIFAEGLHGPQGLLVDPDGNLWVAESGFGGEEEIEFVNPQTMEPSTGMMGMTSRIMRISPEGEMTEVAVLPSVFVGEDVIGAARLALLDGTLYVTSGQFTGDPEVEKTMPEFASVVSVVDGETTVVADTWAHEAANNPDGLILDSHPYDIIAHDGMLVVADAAANALFSVDPASGEVSTIAAFTEGLMGVFPNPNRGGEMEADPVPTGVVAAEDGGYYVSYLSGAPFIPGNAKVVWVSADGEISDFAPGLTMLTDLTMGPDGNLYATSFGIFTEEGPQFNSGSVYRISMDGSAEVVASGMPFVTSIAFANDGTGYVAANGVGAPGSGIVYAFADMSSMEGTPVEMPEMEG